LAGSIAAAALFLFVSLIVALVYMVDITSTNGKLNEAIVKESAERKITKCLAWEPTCSEYGILTPLKCYGS
jgi:hypothetical protein